jgi:trans-feruloyl-CoA hydratase/vanillin synthase
MVNGWCFGGAFPAGGVRPAIADEKAVFGLSEINWGIPPGNLVSKAVAIPWDIARRCITS